MRSRISLCIIALFLLSGCGAPPAAQGFIQQHMQCPPILYSGPRWSPDGTRIAFAMSDYSLRSMYLDMIDVNSLGYTRLGTFNDGVQGPSWSPDSSRLVAFLHRSDIYVIDTVTSNESRIISDMGESGKLYKLYDDADWSPDGKYLALTGYLDGYAGPSTITTAPLSAALIDDGIDRGAPYPVMQELSDELGPVQGDTPRWSPDSDRIAYVDSWAHNPTIYVINADGTGKVAVASHPALTWWASHSLSWSPDGQQLAYFGAGGSGTPSIYTVNLNGTQNLRLTSGAFPDFAPDGKRIVFVGIGVNGLDEIFVMNLDGTGTRQLTRNPGNTICLH